MDRGIWAIWYDLPEQGEDEYLEWLHEKYIPEALSRHGYLWAAHVRNLTPEERFQGAPPAFSLTHTDDSTVPAGNLLPPAFRRRASAHLCRSQPRRDDGEAVGQGTRDAGPQGLAPFSQLCGGRACGRPRSRYPSARHNSGTGDTAGYVQHQRS